jgi:hypothetical protein
MTMARKHLMGEVNLLGLNSLGDPVGMNPLIGVAIGGGAANLTALVLGNMAWAQNPLTPTGTPPAQDRHMWGLLAGLASAGILAATGVERRAAAWGAALGAFLVEGLPWLEKFFMNTLEAPAQQVAAGAAVNVLTTQAAATGAPVSVTVPAPTATGAATVTVAPAPAPAAAGTSGMGIARVHALNGGLGIPRVHALNGGLGMRKQAGGQYLNGLGLATVQAVPQSVGTIPGVAGPAFAGTQIGSHSPVNGVGAPTAQSRQVQLLGGPQIHGLSAAYGATLLGGGR